MEINTVSPRDFMVIQGYGDKGFRISGQRYEGSVLILPRSVATWPVASVDAIHPDGLALLADPQNRVEVLLIGTGQRMERLNRTAEQRLRDAFGIPIEVMDTGAACRTYNVLLAEMRPVAAALIAV